MDGVKTGGQSHYMSLDRAKEGWSHYATAEDWLVDLRGEGHEWKRSLEGARSVLASLN